MSSLPIPEDIHYKSWFPPSVYPHRYLSDVQDNLARNIKIHRSYILVRHTKFCSVSKIRWYRSLLKRYVQVILIYRLLAATAYHFAWSHENSCDRVRAGMYCWRQAKDSMFNLLRKCSALVFFFFFYY